MPTSDVANHEQLPQARLAGRLLPSPNAAAARAKLNDLVNKFEVPFRTARSKDQLGPRRHRRSGNFRAAHEVLGRRVADGKAPR